MRGVIGESSRREMPPHLARALFAACVLLFASAVSVAAESVLPQAEELLPPGETLSSQATVYVRAFRFEGNTVFTEAELAQVLKDYIGRTLTSEDLQKARQLLTLHYVNRGYINSGAVLPDQKVEDGVVLFQIVEGKLTNVAISGNRRTKASYIEARVRRAADSPLNLLRLQDNLEIMRQSPIFERLQAELQPGTAPGQGRLQLNVEERSPFTVGLELANDRSPGVGAERLDVLLSDQNLTGVADALSLRYGLAGGGFDNPKFSGLDRFGVLYSRPISASDTRLILGYSRDDELLVEAPFENLDITSETDTFTVGLWRPFYRTPSSEFAMSLKGEVRRNLTKLMGQPFSFSPGAENGRSKVSVLRFGQEWSSRAETHALAVNSTFSFGLPVLGATHHASLPDSRFIAWLGQAQYIQRLAQTDNQLILRLSTQLANDSLLSLEQFGIGGMSTVRGYRVNEIVRDQGAVGTAELRIPIVRKAGGPPLLQLAPFADLGYGWNAERPRDGEFLSSVGLGLLLQVEHRVEAELYLGVPFRHFHHEQHDLQDAGIHFRILVGRF
jgi:hemolysin activation/secretion protein